MYQGARGARALQAVDSSALRPDGDAAPVASGGQRTAWTAYGLHAGELPELDADRFIVAGAAAERAARDHVTRANLAGILRRALEQAAALRGPPVSVHQAAAEPWQHTAKQRSSQADSCSRVRDPVSPE